LTHAKHPTTIAMMLAEAVKAFDALTLALFLGAASAAYT